MQLHNSFRLSNRIKRVFLFILGLSFVYVIFSLFSSVSIFEVWQEKRYEMVEKSANEWLHESQKNLSFASYAMKPRKSDLADFIEADNFRSIEVVMDEMRVLYDLDGAFLENEYGQFIDHNGLINNPSLTLRHFLKGLDEGPDFRLIDNIDLATGSKYRMSPKGLYVGIKIPVRYDVGDVAGYVYLIKQVIGPDHVELNSNVLKELDSFEFVARDTQVHSGMSEQGWLEMLDALFVKQKIIYKMPIYASNQSFPIGSLVMSQSTQVILPVFSNQLLLSVVPILFLTLSLMYFYRLLMQRMIAPVDEMSEVAKRIYEGEQDARLNFMRHQDSQNFSEVDALGFRFNELMDALSNQKNDLTTLNEELETIVLKRTMALTESNEKLEKLAHSDALTGIDNRHAFDIYWADIEDRARHGSLNAVGFCIVDCDYFKGINDTYGHHAGDQVLTIISDLIRSSIEPSARMFRLGGDEFAVIYESTPLETIESNMKGLADAVAAYPVDEIQIKEQLSTSIGIAHADKGSISRLMDLFRHADTAMYVAKRSLRKKFVVYDDTEHAKTYEELKHQHVHSVLDAIKTGEGMVLFYQPVLGLDNMKVDYFEVLTRLEIDDDLVFPNIFLPIVERTNLQVQFDKMVIQKVREALEQGKIADGVGLSINLSAEALVDEKVCDWFKPLTPYLNNHKIVIEITETTLITQLNEVSGYIDQFKKAGFKVALDDFGSGYSSINYLAHLPVDIIKFDISLARAAFQKQRSAKLIESLIDDLSEMGYSIVIEGIEDKQMFNALIKMKPSHFQGYYINRPAAEPNTTFVDSNLHISQQS